MGGLSLGNSVTIRPIRQERKYRFSFWRQQELSFFACLADRF
jgi:hypothetical protein